MASADVTMTSEAGSVTNVANGTAANVTVSFDGVRVAVVAEDGSAAKAKFDFEATVVAEYDPEVIYFSFLFVQTVLNKTFVFF